MSSGGAEGIRGGGGGEEALKAILSTTSLAASWCCARMRVTHMGACRRSCRLLPVAMCCCCCCSVCAGAAQHAPAGAGRRGGSGRRALGRTHGCVAATPNTWVGGSAWLPAASLAVGVLGLPSPHSPCLCQCQRRPSNPPPPPPFLMVPPPSTAWLAAAASTPPPPRGGVRACGRAQRLAACGLAAPTRTASAGWARAGTSWRAWSGPPWCAARWKVQLWGRVGGHGGWGLGLAVGGWGHLHHHQDWSAPGQPPVDGRFACTNVCKHAHASPAALMQMPLPFIM